MGLATIDLHSHKVQTKISGRYPNILTFLNRCISVKISLINTKLGVFVNLGVLYVDQ